MKLTYPPESKPLEGYTIKRAVARGGFGEVYYALSDAGKEVALKLLRQNLEVELRGVSQCLNLNHPNLVSIHDIRTDKQGDHWIIMEYISGKTLDHVLEDLNGPMPMSDIRHWLGEISSGLSYLHSRGLVHRDLKPANIFEQQGTIKIGDVGLSKFISHSQANAQTQSVGTVYYMAPEVAHGRYGKPVDVYALGVMLYEMLTGQVPFDGESQAEILMKHLSEQPDLNQLTPRLRPVLAKALEKDPNRRYQSAAELEREFERAAKDVENGIELAQTVYASSSPPPRPQRVAAPAYELPREERTEKPYERYRYSRYAGRGERSQGLGAMKWVLIGIVALVFFPRFLGHPVSFRLLVFGGLAAAGVYAYRRMSRYATGTPVGANARPINQARPARPTREDLRYEAQLRRDRKIAAMEKRRETVHRVREERRAQKIARRHQRGYANVSKSIKRDIPLRQRALEFSASATFAALVTVVITAGLFLTTSFLGGPRVALFGVIALASAWALLGTAKLLEGGDHGWSHKRLLFFTGGALVGLAAWFVSANLFIDFNGDADGLVNAHHHIGTLAFTNEIGQPLLSSFVLFFAGLFGLRRWGWHADSFRDARFRLRSVFLTTCIGWLWGAIVGFPIFWAVLWAAALSCIVQLSANWVAPEDRLSALQEGQSHE